MPPIVLAGALTLLPQATPAPARLPVAVFAIVDHQVDSSLARSLTQWLIGAFRRDTSLQVIERSGKIRPRGPQAVYGVVTDLDRAKNGAPQLTIRVVDVMSVYLVAMARVSGPPDSLQRALPGIADGLGERLRALHAVRRANQAPPHWQVPTGALQAYSRALLFLDRGDTVTAKAHLREALKIAPKYPEACDNLKRLEPAAPCGR